MKSDKNKKGDNSSEKTFGGINDDFKELFLNKEKANDLKDHMARHWNEVLEDENLPEKDLNHILLKLYCSVVRKKEDKSEKKLPIIFRAWRAYAKVAAVLLLPLGVIWMLYVKNLPGESKDGDSLITLNAPLGSKLQFRLPDGSWGWLNSGSSISYSKNFGKQSRDVELMGEAWFDVKKNKRVPFNVFTPVLDISVTGTKFNVNAYEGDKVDVVLESGQVILKADGLGKLKMKPRDRVVVDAESQQLISKTSVETEKYSGWKDGKLIFRNDSMGEIANRLGRWYNVIVEVKNLEGRELKLRATFEDEPIDEVLRLLQMSLPIDYEIKPQKDGVKTKVIITIKQTDKLKTQNVPSMEKSA